MKQISNRNIANIANKISAKDNILIKKDSESEKKYPVFETWHMRPKLSENITTKSTFFDYPEVGLVLQGALKHEDNFTLESVRIYKKHFPSVLIIVSTWDDVDQKDLEKLREEGVKIVLSKKPESYGALNINLQLVSSFAGIKYAQQNGCKYVFKTRTDQRMYATDIIPYLLGLLKLFPLENEQIQKERIIALSFNTFKYRIYGVSDMWTFGRTEDMVLLWGCPNDQRDPVLIEQQSKVKSHFREYYQLNIGEVYITAHFLQKLNKDLQWTLADYEKYISRNYLIIDSNSIDLFWNKYTNQEFRWLSYAESDFIEYSFKDWLILYTSHRETENF